MASSTVASPALFRGLKVWNVRKYRIPGGEKPQLQPGNMQKSLILVISDRILIPESV